ncbi:MAG: chromosome (plasmid) partitioning protein ParB [Deltaproteobacteria bacterium]|nr:chromosome (plasmid) partitioning protein ParB [Deltaproteobacteria bacterium]
MERKKEPVKKKVLGRGLSALLTSTTPSAAAPGGGRDPGFLQIPLEKIRAGSLQPRRTFSPEPLEELVASIREKGILQPVLVRPTPDGYELVAGERRFRAAESAGLSTIPAVVRKLTDREALEAERTVSRSRTPCGCSGSPPRCGRRSWTGGSPPDTPARSCPRRRSTRLRSAKP